ncbi:hypothetical protein GGS26DRAFT_569976 [Hypomontagnella submonticulosa]|nr:hypothetical protein GGS26DRAFT_569976 [Hypomontagnella submonticulosa]
MQKMSATLSSNVSTTKRKWIVLVALAASTLLSISLLVTWLVLPRGQATMWLENAKSWLLSEFRGPYTPTEELLILSSVVSMVVSGVIEALLFAVPQNSSKHTKIWLRYAPLIILSANATLAFVAFFYALVNSGMLAEGHTGIMGDTVLGEKYHQNTQSYTGHMHSVPPAKGVSCGRPVVSLWLALLITIFSTILAVSAWLDFREQDRDEWEIPRFEKESLNEKMPIFTDEII